MSFQTNGYVLIVKLHLLFVLMFRVLNQVIRSTNLRSVAVASVSPARWSMSPFQLTGGGLMEREFATKKLKMKTPRYVGIYRM